jgi:hypothetical protein
LLFIRFPAKTVEVLRSGNTALSQDTSSLAVLIGAIFLVTIPVFVQAPLVRWNPLLGMGLTLVWVGLGFWLKSLPRWSVWGDLLLGFSMSWFAGALYWGWLRWEPGLHIPIESIAVPVALLGLWGRWMVVGSCFYLGSLLGTAMTDLYFYSIGVMSYWRPVLESAPQDVPELLGQALLRTWTVPGLFVGMLILGLLGGSARLALSRGKVQWFGFAGAVLGTILVDCLFVVAAF